MRHRKKGYKLGRSASHRRATLAALSNALIRHKRITTTFTKAKALRIYVEPVINRAKEDTSHNRRQAFRRLGDKQAVRVLFDEVALALGERPGGYTRVVKLGQRAGDGAEMAMIELVDFNDVQPEGEGSTRRRRRTRRGGGRGRRKRQQTAAAAPAVVEAARDVAEETAETVEEAAEAVVDTVEDVVEAAGDVIEDAAEAAEEVIGDVVEDVADTVEDALADSSDDDSSEDDAETGAPDEAEDGPREA